MHEETSTYLPFDNNRQPSSNFRTTFFAVSRFLKITRACPTTWANMSIRFTKLHEFYCFVFTNQSNHLTATSTQYLRERERERMHIRWFIDVIIVQMHTIVMARIFCLLNHLSRATFPQTIPYYILRCSTKDKKTSYSKVQNTT